MNTPTKKTARRGAGPHPPRAHVCDPSFADLEKDLSSMKVCPKCGELYFEDEAGEAHEEP
jgi:hypothetical protein